MPLTEEQRLADDIKEGNIETIDDILARFEEIEANYARYEWAWAYRMILDYYDIKSITEDDESRIEHDYNAARSEWLDVYNETLTDFLEHLPT